MKFLREDMIAVILQRCQNRDDRNYSKELQYTREELDELKNVAGPVGVRYTRMLGQGGN